ncbi:unnamed protein product [Linum tenue]|uniref:RING-type domain-containing protein n=3 Tax=Linum tenue TaxID=586396 RepID=A0AAV0LQF7_9ROSI|nr:unnamed protein product [Linum tenue]CAI0436417.1 unnamed protein product [Linum tenue]
MNKLCTKCKEAAASLCSFGGLTTMEPRLESLLVISIPPLLTNILLASFTCIIALGGAAVGTVVGAMKGQTTETGFLRGSIIGAVAGAITSVQLLESIADGEPLSKVALLNSVVNGKVFMEWVGPAVLKAYQFQMRAMEATYREMAADIYDTTAASGLPEHCIQSLPQFTFSRSSSQLLCCSICLQDVEEGDVMRKVPSCGHCFHLECLDKWLVRNGSCPMCRTTDLCTTDDNFDHDHL